MHTFGDLGSTAKKPKNKSGFFFLFLGGGGGGGGGQSIIFRDQGSTDHHPCEGISSLALSLTIKELTSTSVDDP